MSKKYRVTDCVIGNVLPPDHAQSTNTKQSQSRSGGGESTAKESTSSRDSRVGTGRSNDDHQIKVISDVFKIASYFLIQKGSVELKVPSLAGKQVCCIMY